MKKKTKRILIIVSIVVAVAILSVAFSLFLDAIKQRTYSTAKADCEKVLEQHRVQMEELAVDSLKSKKDVSGEFRDFYYSCHQGEGTVSFEIDSQGLMLGGQYWELVYTENGTFNGKTDGFLNKEAYGNNIMKAERLDEHWWFVWTDFDGTDLSDQ